GSAIDAVQEVVGRELTFVSAGLRQATAPPAYNGPAGDVADARQLGAEAQAMQIIGMQPMMQSELIEPALVPARDSAWNTAKETGNLAQYQPLLTAFGPVVSLQQDVQYVRTTLRLQSRDDTNYLIASIDLPFAHFPDLPAEPARTAQVGVRAGGTIQLSGHIATLQCPNSDDEQLKVSFDGVEVASVASSGASVLSDALPAFLPAALLARVGLPATDTGSHTLVVRRTGGSCAATLGLADDVLATITLDFGAAEPPLKKFETCGLYFQGNAFPVEGGPPVTAFQLQRNPNTGVYTLYQFPVYPVTLQLPERFIPGALPWPDGTSTTMSGDAVGQGWGFGGARIKVGLSFSVDAQNRHRFTGSISGYDSEGNLTDPFTVDASCGADIQ